MEHFHGLIAAHTRRLFEVQLLGDRDAEHDEAGLVAARDGEEQKDLAELDLQLTDNALYLINAMGYKLQ